MLRDRQSLHQDNSVTPTGIPSLTHDDSNAVHDEAPFLARYTNSSRSSTASLPDRQVTEQPQCPLSSEAVTPVRAPHDDRVPRTNLVLWTLI